MQSVSRVPTPVRCRYFSGACVPAHGRRYQLTLICRIPAVAVISGDDRLRCVLRHHAGFRQVSTQRALHTPRRSLASVNLSQSLAKLGPSSVLGCRVSAKQEGNAVTTDLAVARRADRSRRVFLCCFVCGLAWLFWELWSSTAVIQVWMHYKYGGASRLSRSGDLGYVWCVLLICA